MHRGSRTTSTRNQIQMNRYRAGERNLRVVNLDLSVSDNELISYFQRYYGIDCVERGTIVRDPLNGRSKGFGYVTFADSYVASRVLSERNHLIGTKRAYCKIALPKIQPRDDTNKHLREIYVGNLNVNYTIKDLQDYFSIYGEIESSNIACDSNRKPLGFGFVTFQRVESVNFVQENRPHSINGEQVQTRRNYPKDLPIELKKPHTVLYVLNYDGLVNEGDIVEYFSERWNIKSVSSKTKRPENKRYMEMVFDDYDDVDVVCLANDHTINGCRIYVTKFPGTKEFDRLFKAELSYETAEPVSYTRTRMHSFSYERKHSEGGNDDCVNCCCVIL